MSYPFHRTETEAQEDYINGIDTHPVNGRPEADSASRACAINHHGPKLSLCVCVCKDVPENCFIQKMKRTPLLKF